MCRTARMAGVVTDQLLLSLCAWLYVAFWLRGCSWLGWDCGQTLDASIRDGLFIVYCARECLSVVTRASRVFVRGDLPWRLPSMADLSFQMPFSCSVSEVLS